MELVQHVYSVLAISTREKFYTSLRGLLPEDRYSPLCWESDVTSARRLLLERTFDIVVISTPLPDEFGTKLAMHVVDSSSAGVLLLVGAEHYPDISVRLSPYGILTLQKPTTPQLILQSLQLLCGTRERLRKMEQKTASIEEKMAEIRLVNRAKWLLIDREGAGRPPLYRKAGHGSLRHPPGRRRSDHRPLSAGLIFDKRNDFCYHALQPNEKETRYGKVHSL